MLIDSEPLKAWSIARKNIATEKQRSAESEATINFQEGIKFAFTLMLEKIAELEQVQEHKQKECDYAKRFAETWRP